MAVAPVPLEAVFAGVGGAAAVGVGAPAGPSLFNTACHWPAHCRRSSGDISLYGQPVNCWARSRAASTEAISEDQSFRNLSKPPTTARSSKPRDSSSRRMLRRESRQIGEPLPAGDIRSRAYRRRGPAPRPDLRGLCECPARGRTGPPLFLQGAAGRTAGPSGHRPLRVRCCI